MSAQRSIQKVLIANRGEIAVRVIRTCREMGIATVAVYSDADRAALHVRLADEALHIGPAPARQSYLDGEAIVRAAVASGADAIHPGYGFLSERAEFARLVEQHGLVFIGPRPESMDAMGVKTAAREKMRSAGVPVVPGSAEPFATEDEARAFAESIGYPVMIKAAGGGGGKGMKRCDRADAFGALWQSAKREAASAFGDDRLYVEKFLDRPRHVEIQVFADEHGNTVYLGERECSVQRRQQKIVEETPSAIVDDAMRRAMGEVAVRAARAVNYRGAGTVEMLVDASRSFYFLEMNTRLQVEHPVTELVTGLDLVKLQIQVARGERLPITQEQVDRRGHAIEARVYAEDPWKAFLPSPGRITYLRVPGGPGVRDDSGVYEGWTVPPFYDPMISKLVAWAPTRAEAIDRLRRALREYVVHGITVNVRYLLAVLDHPAFRSGDYDTGFCVEHEKALLAPPADGSEEVALVAAAVAMHDRDGAGEEPRAYVAVHDGGKREELVEVAGGPGPARDVTVRGRRHRADFVRHDAGTMSLILDRASHSVHVEQRRQALRVQVEDALHIFELRQKD